MYELGIALLIFCMRIADVSIGTIRTIYTIRGRRGLAMLLGIIESGIWILAISKAVELMKYNPWAMVGWACGFGVGTYTGITIEKWIASGHILMRVISVDKARVLRDALLAEEVGVTAVPGEGRSGDVLILFVVAPRKRGDALLKTIQELDPEAFITVDPVSQAIGGYMPIPVDPKSLRK